jgi:hypothetical protein
MDHPNPKNPKPRSFREHIAQSIVARDEELRILRQIVKENTCKVCKKGIRNSTVSLSIEHQECFACGFRTCWDCWNDMILIRFPDCTICNSNSINFCIHEAKYYCTGCFDFDCSKLCHTHDCYLPCTKCGKLVCENCILLSRNNERYCSECAP